MGAVGRRLIACSLVVLLAGCASPSASVAPTSGASPSLEPVPSASVGLEPSASPMPSAQGSPTASPVAQASDDPDPCGWRPDNGPYTVPMLWPSAAVELAVEELHLRAGPCTAAESIAILHKGRALLVLDQPYGPIKANGYSWYQVMLAPNSYPPGEILPPLPANPIPDGIDSISGWIAANDGEDAYVTPLPPRCPTTVDLENVAGMLPAERLACFNEPITVEGTFGCGGCGGTGGPAATPRWLADTFEFDQVRVTWGGDVQHHPVGIHFRPSGPGAPAEGSIIRVTLSLDVPLAQTCRYVWEVEDPDFTVPVEYGVTWCRERFAVDSYEVIGTDPAYPG